MAKLLELARGADARLESVQNLFDLVVGEVQLHVHADVVSEMLVVIIELERDLRGMHVRGEGRSWGLGRGLGPGWSGPTSKVKIGGTRPAQIYLAGWIVGTFGKRLTISRKDNYCRSW